MKRIFIASVAILLLLASVAPAAQAQGQDAPNPAVEAGMTSFYQEKWADSAAHFEEARKADPRDSMDLNFLFYCAFKTVSLPTVVQKLEQESAAKADDPVLLSALGIGYWFRAGMGETPMLDEALNQFKEALKVDENCSIAHCGMGLVYYYKRMMPRAKGHFLKAVQNNPRDLMALERLGEILMVDDKKPDQAADIFRRLVAAAPHYPDGHYYLGSALYDLKEYDEALKELKISSDLDPKGIGQGYYAMALAGDTYLVRKDFKNATDWYKRALEVRPDSAYIKLKLDKAANNGVTPPVFDPKKNS